jgi:predicted DsbA family dithiol-disulfide isomerase
VCLHTARCQRQTHEYHEEAFKAYFTNGKDIGNIDVISDIIKLIGLDTDKFKDAFDKGIYNPALEKTQRDAYTSSINSTPTFIINDNNRWNYKRMYF